MRILRSSDASPRGRIRKYGIERMQIVGKMRDTTGHLTGRKPPTIRFQNCSLRICSTRIENTRQEP